MASTSKFALIGVDGTGFSNMDAYEMRMRNSFVSRVVRESRTPCKIYRRGPGVTGLGHLVERPHQLAAEIVEFHKWGFTRILMTGYSRGGAIVINTSALLKKAGIKVEALFLFDAVDRSLLLEARDIPSNVDVCYHAIRCRDVRSRETFGNCGLQKEAKSPGYFDKRDFITTHGGMGGVCWGERGLPAIKNVGNVLDPKTLQKWSSEKEQLAWGKMDEGGIDQSTRVTAFQERIGSQEVWGWMLPRLQEHGVL